jgi:hypothetical protein
MTRGNGHYEIRHHLTPGLVSITWIEPGQPEYLMTAIAEDRLDKLREAISVWERKHPTPAPTGPDGAEVPPPRPPRIRTGGQRAGALSIANSTEPEDGTGPAERPVP